MAWLVIKNVATNQTLILLLRSFPVVQRLVISVESSPGGLELRSESGPIRSLLVYQYTVGVHQVRGEMIVIKKANEC